MNAPNFSFISAFAKVAFDTTRVAMRERVMAWKKRSGLAWYEPLMKLMILRANP